MLFSLGVNYILLLSFKLGALYGFSDQMSVLTLGERKVPFMIDNNPSMYRYKCTGFDCYCHVGAV